MSTTINYGDSFDIHESVEGWVCEKFLQSGKRLEHTMPAPRKSFLARLLSGRLLMKEIPPDIKASIVALEGKVLVELKLSDDDVVVTRMPRVAGLVGTSFDGGRISPSLTAFSLGHTIMHTLRGRGTVYFESASRSVRILQGDGVSEQSFDPSSIICFGAGSEFVVTSGRKFWSLFVGTWQLELKSGWVVIDVGARGSGGVGIGAILKRIYLPWS